MQTKTAIVDFIAKEPYTQTTYSLNRDQKLIDLISERLESLGIRDIKQFAAGNQSLVLLDETNMQIIKLAVPFEDLWCKKSWQREIFKPFDITQHIEYLRSDEKAPLMPLKGIVVKIMPKMMLVSDLPLEEQHKAAIEYSQIFMKKSGVSAEFKPENIAIITDNNGKPIKPKHSSMTYLYIPIDLGNLFLKTEDRDHEFLRDYLESGVDKSGTYSTTLQKYYPQLRSGGKVMAQDGTSRIATRNYVNDQSQML